MYSLIPEKPLRLVYEPWNDAIRHIFTDISTLTEPKQDFILHIRETQKAIKHFGNDRENLFY